MEFSSVPWTTGGLDPKVRELIYIAIDSATTHMYEPGLRVHIQNAFKYGATVQEIMEVYRKADLGPRRPYRHVRRAAPDRRA